MARDSRTQKLKEEIWSSDLWKEGLDPVEIAITPKLEAALKEMAWRAGMDYAEYVSLVLEDYVMQRVKLEELVGRMVKEAIDKELKRIEQIIQPLLSPLSQKGEKKISN